VAPPGGIAFATGENPVLIRVAEDRKRNEPGAPVFCLSPLKRLDFLAVLGRPWPAPLPEP